MNLMFTKWLISNLGKILFNSFPIVVFNSVEIGWGPVGFEKHLCLPTKTRYKFDLISFQRSISIIYVLRQRRLVAYRLSFLFYSGAFL